MCNKRLAFYDDMARILIELATKKNLKIMVDHTFIFTGAVKKIKNIINENVLGNLYYNREKL